MSPRKSASISLLELETSAIELAQALQSETTPGHKRLLFFSFFCHLAALPEPARFRSYYLQFAPALPEVTHDLVSSCWDPADLERWLEDMPRFRAFAEPHTPLLDEAEENIRAAAIVHAIHAGDEAAAWRFSGLEPREVATANRSRLEMAQNLLPELPASLRSKVARWVHEWEQEIGMFSADKIYMMLIDIGAAAANGNNSGGLLIPLYASGRERPADAEEDLCQLNNQVYFGKHALYWTLLDGIQATRKFLPAAAAKWHYAVHYSIPEKSADMNGTSLGLAAALLAWSTSLNCYHKHPAIKLGANVAVTGGIDSDGRITAVAVAGLRAKITAAFFSRIDRLYIPAANWHEAVQIQAQLERRYPQRHLLIHPLETLEQALQDRNLVERTRPGFARRILALLRRKRSRPALQIITAVIMMALLLANLPAFMARFDRTPERFEFQGNEMVCRNPTGHTLWKYTFSFKPTANAYGQEKGTILVDDIDGDGHKETIVGTHEGYQPEQSATLYAFSAKGSLLWPPLRLGQELKTQTGELIDDFYHTNQILAVPSAPGQPKSLLVTIAHNESYPSCLALVSFSGKITGAFWNAGHILASVVEDIDRDGDPEFMAGGYDNETSCAWMAVFHLKELQGALPRANPHYMLAEIPLAQPSLFLRFPPSPFRLESSHHDLTVQIEPDGPKIRIYIANAGVYYGMASPEKSVMYRYILSSDFKNILLYTLPDYFYAQYNANFKHSFDPAGLERLLNVERWDGSAWEPFTATYGKE